MPAQRCTTHRTSRHSGRALLHFALSAAIAHFAGCQVFDQPPDAALEKLLRPVTTAPDSVTLEVFYARIPLEKEGKADALWPSIDEQCFDAELRRRLMANGLRAGVVGGALPDGLADLLALQSEMPVSGAAREITGQAAVPRVMRQLRQINRRDEMAIPVCEPRDEAEVLVSENGRMGGNTFKKVRGVYKLQAESIPGQRVKVRIVPELQHGDMRNRTVGSDQGILLKIVSPDREVFEQLTMQTELAPGQLLILGCLPEAQASLGGVFHTELSSGAAERKLIIVRLLEVPPSEILAKK